MIDLRKGEKKMDNENEQILNELSKIARQNQGL